MLKRSNIVLTLVTAASLAMAPSYALEDDCRKCLTEATQLLSDGDAVKAGELMQSLSTQCANNATFQTLLATIQLRLSNIAEAERASLRAIEIAPNSTAAHFQYALVLKSAGKLESAVTEFDKVVDLDPGNWESFASLADLYKQLHQDEKAKQCAYKAATLAAPTLDARNNLFKNLIRQGKLLKAQEEFKKSINSNLQNPIVLQQLAKQALKFNFWNEAILASQAVLSTFPDSQEALTTKATAEFFLHKYADCQNTVNAITKISPDDNGAKVLSALCLIDLGEIGKAAELLEAANAPKDNMPLSVLAVAKWHQARGDFKAAESQFGSISDEAYVPEAQIALAHLYLKQGKLDEASERATFKPFSEISSSRMLAAQAEALCLDPTFGNTSLDKARQLATKALTNSPNEPLALLAMAKIELASDKKQVAQEMANKVIQVVPGLADSYLVLAQIETANGNSKEAEKQLDKALSLANDDPEASLLLGKIYLLSGNIKKALDSLKVALANRQESAEICYVLAKALEQDGDRSQSLKYYKQSLSLGLVGAENTEATQAVKRLSGN